MGNVDLMARGHLQQRENGTFRVLAYAGRDPLTGKDRRRTATAHSRKEAEQLRTRLLSDIDQGSTGGGSKATIGYVLERWLETTDLELTIRYCYEQQYIISKILPALGDVPRAQDHCRGARRRVAQAGREAQSPATGLRRRGRGQRRGGRNRESRPKNGGQMITERIMIHGPTVWSGSTLDEQDWLVPLEDEWLYGLEAVTTRMRAANIAIADVTPADFRTPEFVGLAERAIFALENGPGLVVLRGWRVAEWGEEATSLLCWGLGAMLGAPRSQGPRGDRIRLVTDTTIGAANKSEPIRKGMSSKELAFHTDRVRPPDDPPRVLGLLCLRRAVQGGASLIVSGHSVHNRLLEQHPELLEQLYQNFHFGRSVGTYADGALTDVGPVFEWRAGRLSVRYSRYWIERGHEAAGKPLSCNARAALDAFDEILADRAMALCFFLLPGDLLLIDNHVVLHGRTAFVDAEDPRARRCLARFWLD